MASHREKKPTLNRPFEKLRDLLTHRPAGSRSQPPEVRLPATQSGLSARPEQGSETALFQAAMADVTPLKNTERIAPLAATARHRILAAAGDKTTETEDRLRRLIADGTGFVVADTPEYMEGTGNRVHPHLARQLHSGRFAIQAHIDLHGFTAVEAGSAFDTFLRQSLRQGKRSLLIIHGRGLCSPAEPVLKKMVYQWLTRGPWRKWVLAFSSARIVDGGAGATYVLLRRRPLPKRLRKKKTP